MYGIHPPRQEILKQYRACYKELRRTPGIRLFCQLTGVKKADVYFYWTYFDDLVREVGGTPNKIPTPLTDEQIFREYARVCLHLGRIPGQLELHHTASQIGARVYSVYARFGRVAEFDRRFRAWLLEAPEELKAILKMPGWRRPGFAIPPLPRESPDSSWLPGLLRDLETLAQKKMPPRMANPDWNERIFDARCGDAFRALGFKLTEKPRHVGRLTKTLAATDLPAANPANAERLAAIGAELAEAQKFAPNQPGRTQVIAVTPERTYGVVLACEARQGNYVLPKPSDRTLSEWVREEVGQLRREEISRVYLACIGPCFRETDLAARVDCFAGCGLAGVTLFSAAAILRIVEGSIRDRATFSVARFEATLVGNNLVL